MTQDELNDLEVSIHDAWALLNLTTYATQSVLTDVTLIEGTPNTPGALYSIDNEGLGALWGALEAMGAARDLLWKELQKI